MTEHCQAKPRPRAPFAVRKDNDGRWRVYARWQRGVDGRVYEEGEDDLGCAYNFGHALAMATTPSAIDAEDR